MKHFLYLISGPCPGVYVGISKDPAQRWRHHRKEKKTHPLYDAMRLHGRDTFSMRVIAEFDDLESARLAEIEMIRLLNSQEPEYGFNRTKGGEYDAAGGGEVLRKKLQTDGEFSKAYSLRSSRTVTEVWARRSDEEKQEIFSAISQTLKRRVREDPEFRRLQQERMLAARAKGDIVARGRAASRGIKQFWEDLRNDPERYADYIDRRRQTLKETNRRKSK